MVAGNICMENVTAEGVKRCPPKANLATNNQFFYTTVRNDRDNIIVNLTTGFALKSIDFAEVLEEKKKYVIARQLLRSGTSIGANVREAQNAESRADFIHKFKIAAKEADETFYWLTLCMKASSYPKPAPSFLAELDDISRVITKIIATSKSKRN